MNWGESIFDVGDMRFYEEVVAIWLLVMGQELYFKPYIIYHVHGIKLDLLGMYTIRRN